MRLRMALASIAQLPESDARTRAHSESFAKQMIRSARTLHEFTQPIVWERFDAMIVAASHRMVIN